MYRLPAAGVPPRDGTPCLALALGIWEEAPKSSEEVCEEVFTHDWADTPPCAALRWVLPALPFVVRGISPEAATI